MNYKEIGKCFTDEINKLLAKNKVNAAFVTGGGYAYDSIKYCQNQKQGDFDFMIIYNDTSDIDKILKLLENTCFDFEKKYLKLDKELLNDGKIDIIRLSGYYKEIKSTINLVPKKLISKISQMEKEVIIKKVAHSRNTSLFFSYGSDASRIITIFVAPSFVTDDNEDHYIHLDISLIEKNDNIYLGILSDAVLKGFNKNYDNIGFELLRKNFIKNIHYYFEQKNIDSNKFISLFANNNYFPEYLKSYLLNEFNEYGVINGQNTFFVSQDPIIFTTDFNINLPQIPFNFINNKDYKMNFKEYILLMQNNEYDRQYLIDALGKFFGYLLSSMDGEKIYRETNILDKILVYGTNDLYFPEINVYNKVSIVNAIIKEINSITCDYNNELVKDYLLLCIKFIENNLNISKKEKIKVNNINSKMFQKKLDSKQMNIEVIKNIESFNEMGIYHNYTSSVMKNYTKKETDFLLKEFTNKKSRVLDIMCGYGRVANEMKNLGFHNITGIDMENYDFLGVPKDFVFIENDFLKYDFNEKYNYAYSLYNCYRNSDELKKLLNKSYSLLEDNGKLIIDCFNKSWRDSINPEFFKELYADKNYKLIIKRSYNNIIGKEITLYELYYNSKKIKTLYFNQKFFELNEIYEIISNDWNFEINNSLNSQTRGNNQKHILVLRKKNE